MAAALWHALWPGVQGPPVRAAFGCSAALLLAALWLMLSAPALAQEPAATDGTVDAGELERLVETLESPESRERFIADLKTAIAAQQTADEGDSAEEASAMRAISDGVAVLGTHIVELAGAIADIPDAIAWVVEHGGEPDERNDWLVAFGRLLASVAAGVIAGLAAFYALTVPRRRLERREKPSPWLQPPLLLYHAALRLAPNLVAAGAGYGAVTLIEPGETVRVIALAIINAHLIASLAKAAGTLVLAPYAPQLRLAPLSDVNAAYCSIWWRRLVNIGAYGYILCQAGLLLGLPESGYAALIRLLGILLVGLLITFILQNRAPLARWLHETGRAHGGRAHLRVFALLGKLADFWHIPAILYVVAGGLLAAADGLDGFLFLVKGSAATLVIAWATGFGFAGIRRAMERGFRIRTELRERYPGLQARVNRYLPVARGAAQAVILLLGLCLILEAWNADIFTWLASETGTAVIATLASIVAIAVIAALVLEVVTTLVDRYLSATDETGEQVERSQRARTLLPLARNALRVVVGVIAALMILSEIGIDIAPVLAGVGVAGLAIGFGAQTLVKDIITGLFILLEDSVAVGDVVTAGGHTGTVEAITVRTIRLGPAGARAHGAVQRGRLGLQHDQGLLLLPDRHGGRLPRGLRRGGGGHARGWRGDAAGPRLRPQHAGAAGDHGAQQLRRFRGHRPRPAEDQATHPVGHRAGVQPPAQGGLRRPRHRDPLPPHADLLRRGQAGPGAGRARGHRRRAGERRRPRLDPALSAAGGRTAETGRAARTHAARAGQRDQRRAGGCGQRLGRGRAGLGRAA